MMFGLENECPILSYKETAYCMWRCFRVELKLLRYALLAFCYSSWLYFVYVVMKRVGRLGVK